MALPSSGEDVECEAVARSREVGHRRGVKLAFIHELHQGLTKAEPCTRLPVFYNQ